MASRTQRIFISDVQLSKPDPSNINIIEVAFDAIDVEDDEVYILPKFQYEGDPTWHPVVANEEYLTWHPVPADTDRVGPFSASAAGP